MNERLAAAYARTHQTDSTGASWFGELAPAPMREPAVFIGLQLMAEAANLQRRDAQRLTDLLCMSCFGRT